MRRSSLFTSLALLVAFVTTLAVRPAAAQNPPGNGNGNTVPVQLVTGYWPLTPISATGAVNVATVLTIPAPSNPNFFNYICSLAFELNSDGTGGAISNQVSTSTNFNAFAVKASFPATVSIDSGIQIALPTQTPGTGCYKSAAAGVATTFTAPASSAHIAWTWYASYYQGQ